MALSPRNCFIPITKVRCFLPEPSDLNLIPILNAEDYQTGLDGFSQEQADAVAAVTTAAASTLFILPYAKDFLMFSLPFLSLSVLLPYAWSHGSGLTFTITSVLRSGCK